MESNTKERFTTDSEDVVEYIRNTPITWDSACREIIGGGICESNHIGYDADDEYHYYYGNDGGFTEENIKNFKKLLKSGSRVGLGEHGKGLRVAINKINTNSKNSKNCNSMIISKHKGEFTKITIYEDLSFTISKKCNNEDIKIHEKYLENKNGTLFKLPIPKKTSIDKSIEEFHINNIKNINTMFLPRFLENNFKFKHNHDDIDISKDKDKIKEYFFSESVNVTMKRGDYTKKFIEFSDNPTFFKQKGYIEKYRKFDYKKNALSSNNKDKTIYPKSNGETICKCKIFYNELHYTKTETQKDEIDAFLKKYFNFAKHKTASCGFFLENRKIILNDVPFGYGPRGAGFHCRPICIIKLDSVYENQIKTHSDKSKVTLDQCESELKSIIKFFTDTMEIKSNKKNEEDNTKNEEDNKKKRIEFNQKTKNYTRKNQDNRCAITQQKLHDNPNLFDYDHKDGNNQNIDKNNCQAIILGAHRIKTNNLKKSDKIKANPLIYNVDSILNALNTPSILALLEQLKNNGRKIENVPMKEILSALYNEISDEDKKYMNNSQETIDEIFT